LDTTQIDHHANKKDYLLIMSDQLTDFEIRLAFMDDSIRELNATVTTQQIEIERLKKLVELLHSQIAKFSPPLTASENNEEPPPHY